MHLVANTILFVFEGERTERLLLQSFRRHYFLENGRSLIAASYGTAIYSLYNDLKNDEFLDLVELLRERSDLNRAALQGIERDDISEIYLFFDHDGHTTNANDDKLLNLLNYFDEETEAGKLYISYPMLEAIKHIQEDLSFSEIRAPIADNGCYKKLVSEVCNPELKHLNELEKHHWELINHQHFMKAWQLFCDEFSLPDSLISQMTVFEKQLQKHIETEESVAVLSAFPLLLLDYYGVSKVAHLCGLLNETEKE